MKYVLIYTSRPDYDAHADREAAEAFNKRVYQWFQRNAGVLTVSGAELLGVKTATTVKHGDNGPVVVDGPFMEVDEIFGFSIIEVADRNQAIALAKTWPMLELPGAAVEIRPAVEHYSEFE